MSHLGGLMSCVTYFIVIVNNKTNFNLEIISYPFHGFLHISFVALKESFVF